MKRMKQQNKQSPLARGYTLVEILVVVTIIALVLGIGAGGVKNLTRNKGVENGIPLIKSKFNEARQFAIGRTQTIRLVVHADSGLAFSAADTEKTQTHRSRFLRYVGIAQYVDNNDNPVALNSASGSWKVLERGTMLPDNSFFDTQLSQFIVDKATPSNTKKYVNHTATSNADKALLLAQGLCEVIIPGDTAPVQCYFFEINHLGIPSNPKIEVVASDTNKRVSPRVILSSGRLGSGGGNNLKFIRAGGDERSYAGFFLSRNGMTIDYKNLDDILKE